MKKILSPFISLICLLMMTFTVTTVQASSDPIGMLNNIANQMIAGLKANKASLKSNPQVVYSLAHKIIVPHADLDEMSKRVLPPEVWRKASVSQQRQFEKEFTDILVRTYASALSDYSNQTIKFFPIRGGYADKETVRVDSQINRADGPPVGVIYRLVSRGGSWKVYDMTVEGVSMLESFRSQFADILARGDLAALIKELQQHNINNHS